MSQHDLDVSVRITYKGTKAADVDHHQFERAIAVLRADLNVLKIPHPKVENVSFVYPGCIQFYWRTFKGSVLHRNLQVRIHPRDSDLLDSLLENLSIKSMTLKEWEVYPSSRHPLGGPMTPQHAVHNGYNAHSESLPPTRTPTLSSYPPEKITFNSSSQPEQSTEIDKEAQRILADSFRSFHQFGSSAQPAGSQHILFSSPKSSRRSSLVSPIAAPNGGTTLHGYPPASIARGTLNHLSENAPPDRSRPSPVPEPAQSRRSPPPPPAPAPNLEDLPTINRLTRELSEIRRGIATAAEKESEILDQLKRLNVPGIFQSSPHADHTNVIVLESRMQALEKELQDERHRRFEVENALKDIEREYREPFVVPELLHSFIAISKMTGESLRETLP